MNKNYLRYLIRTRKVLILFFLAVYVCVSLMWNLSGINLTPGSGFYSACKAAIAISLVLTYLLPVLVFSFVHKRSSADLYFALPVSRKEQRITSLVFAFGIAFGYFLITAVIAWILYALPYVSVLRVLAILGYAAFLVITLLAVNSVLFLLGNNFVDGIVMMAAYTMFPLFASIAGELIVMEMVAGGTAGTTEELFVFLSPAWMLVNNFSALLSMNGWLYRHFNLLHLIFCAVFLVCAWFALRKEFDERQTERAEQISDHPLSYPLVINLYAVMFLLLFGSFLMKDPGPELIVLYVLLLVCYVTAGFLYRRKLKVDTKTLGIFAAEAVLCAALMFGMWKTHGFGMADNYSLTGGTGIRYDYNMQVSNEDLGKPMAIKGAFAETHVSFSLFIDNTEAETGSEALTLMEDLRKEAIAAFYRKSADDPVFQGSLQVCNENTEGNIDTAYYYQLNCLLREEELKTISERCKVIVGVWGDPRMNDGEYTLEEYLELRDQT